MKSILCINQSNISVRLRLYTVRESVREKETRTKRVMNKRSNREQYDDIFTQHIVPNFCNRIIEPPRFLKRL